MSDYKKDLRFIITKKCNYNCYFCHGEGVDNTNDELLSSKDYFFIYDVCNKKFNWNTVTLTGGEPLLRKDFKEIVTELYKKNAKITIVSNGEFIDKCKDILNLINRLNISIHTLDEIKYSQIIGFNNKLDKVIKNLMEIRNINPNIKIRINTTIIKGINDSDTDLINLINLADKLNASIKFIELYSDSENNIVPIYDLQQKVKCFNFRYIDQQSDRVIMFNGKVKIIFTKIFCNIAKDYFEPNSYCHLRNDIFITPDGYLKMCRNSKASVYILDEVVNRDIKGLETKFNMANNILGNHCPIIKTTGPNTLAINGGLPILSRNEGKFNHPYITEKIERSVIEQLYNTISIYDDGNIFKKFEYEFSRYHNKKYGVLFNSGTTALWAMYEGIRLKEDDEIICPIYTFFATVSPILFTNAKPIFIDCDEFGNIDYKKIENKITNKTKAIVITHMWGYPCKINEIKKIADKYDLYLLEDCSHAHGGSYKNKKLGEWGDISVFSLQGQKIVTGGEGGILITNNKSIYDNTLLLGHYNKRCKNEISQSNIKFNYAITGKGMKLRAHPIAIRIAYEMFLNLDEYIKIKDYYVKYIVEEIKNIEGLKILIDDNSQNSWYALIIKYDKRKFNNTSIKDFVTALNKEGAIEFDIPSSTCPLDKLELFKNPKFLFPSYKNSFIIDDKYKNANEFYNNIFKMPIWYRQDDFKTIVKYVNALKKVSSYYNNKTFKEVF
ncbi:MAG: aminotransferase class V-fold PLP-dependent enzyme [Clostridiales bacterium]